MAPSSVVLPLRDSFEPGRAVLGGVALAQFTAASEDVRFGFHAFAHVWVVEFERGSVGADSGRSYSAGRGRRR